MVVVSPRGAQVTVIDGGDNHLVGDVITIDDKFLGHGGAPSFHFMVKETGTEYMHTRMRTHLAAWASS